MWHTFDVNPESLHLLIYCRLFLPRVFPTWVTLPSFTVVVPVIGYFRTGRHTHVHTYCWAEGINTVRHLRVHFESWTYNYIRTYRSMLWVSAKFRCLPRCVYLAAKANHGATPCSLQLWSASSIDSHIIVITMYLWFYNAYGFKLCINYASVLFNNIMTQVSKINTQGSYLAFEIRYRTTTKTWVAYGNSHLACV